MPELDQHGFLVALGCCAPLRLVGDVADDNRGRTGKRNERPGVASPAGKDAVATEDRHCR
jgi:hypothetical protein